MLEPKGGRRVTPQLGDESQLGEDQRGQSRLVAHLPVDVEHRAQMGLGGVQVAGAACPHPEPDLRVLLPEPVRLLDRQPSGPLVELPGPRIVTGQHRDPAQTRQLEGHLGPQPEVFGHPQPLAVQPRGAFVVAPHLGQLLERHHGLQLAPLVAQFAEQFQALLAVAPQCAELTLQLGVERQGGERRGGAPPVVE